MVKKTWNNRDISHILESVKAAYIIKKENRFKIAAYDRAASAVRHAGSEVKDIWEEGKLEDLPGVGKNIASHLDELFKTGRVKYFEKIFGKLPEAMFEFIKVPGIGPKLAYKLCRKLKIRKAKSALKELEKAANQGRIRKIEGFGEKSEKEILEGLGAQRRKKRRILLSFAENLSEEIIAYMKKCSAVIQVDALGSLRRKCSTVADIDIAVSSKKGEKAIKHFVSYPKKSKVVESGSKKARILVKNEYQIDLMVEPPESYGSLLQHLTGSKEHNIHLREIGIKKGLSLSEQGIRKRKDPAFAKATAGEENLKMGELIKFKDEKSFYEFLGMSWIPAEIREDNGEIEAGIKAKQGKKPGLPDLIKLGQIKGDLQVHSSFDVEPSHDLGANSMEEMMNKAGELGYKYIAFTEHNPSMSQHTENQYISIIQRKKEKIDKLNYSNTKSTRKKVFVFNSLEIDIRPNGSLACPEKALKYLDFGLVSIHSSFRMEKKRMTERILRGLDHPKIKILGHPTGRLLEKREGYELDWERVFAFCLKKKKYLEINAFPDRLDLPDFLIREAIKNGLKLSLGTDSHSVEQMEYMRYGVYNSRRGWAEKNDIINTLTLDKIRKLLMN